MSATPSPTPASGHQCTAMLVSFGVRCATVPAKQGLCQWWICDACDTGEFVMHLQGLFLKTKAHFSSGAMQGLGLPLPCKSTAYLARILLPLLGLLMNS
jgi:hypothetical protein